MNFTQLTDKWGISNVLWGTCQSMLEEDPGIGWEASQLYVGLQKVSNYIWAQMVPDGDGEPHPVTQMREALIHETEVWYDTKMREALIRETEVWYEELEAGKTPPDRPTVKQLFVDMWSAVPEGDHEYTFLFTKIEKALRNRKKCFYGPACADAISALTSIIF